MRPTTQLAEILPRVTTTVEGIQPDQLDDPTPCSEFTVRGVLEHMIVLGSQFSYLFRGEDPPDLAPPAHSDRVPVAELREVMDDLLDATSSPGAMDRVITAAVGEMPGETFARLVAFDGLVHGWDLATATGQDYDPPTDVVEAVESFARDAITPDMRDGDTFKAPTEAPSGASPLERLVAFSGRSL